MDCVVGIENTVYDSAELGIMVISEKQGLVRYARGTVVRVKEKALCNAVDSLPATERT